jgi:hypothetical protein
LLKLGAIAAPAVVTLKPALAQAAVSMAMCRIPIEGDVDEKGRIVDASFAEARGGKPKGPTTPAETFAAPDKGYYYGQELIDYQTGGTLPDGIYDERHFEAHIKYIKSLKPGDSGFTCLTSLVHKL